MAGFYGDTDQKPSSKSQTSSNSATPDKPDVVVLEHPAMRSQQSWVPSLSVVVEWLDTFAKKLPWWVWLGVGAFIAAGGGAWVFGKGKGLLGAAVS